MGICLIAIASGAIDDGLRLVVTNLPTLACIVVAGSGGPGSLGEEFEG